MKMKLVKVLLLLVVGAMGLSGCQFNGAYDLPLPGKVVSASDGYTVSATFKDVVSVVPRTLVMANDVPVGQVESVKRQGWKAEVVMTVKKDIVLPKAVIASIRQTSLLGEKFIALTAIPGSTVVKDGHLGDGAKVASTETDPEIEDVLGALSALLSGGGVTQLHTISVELNKALRGRQADVRSSLQQLNTFVGGLDKQKADIVSTMDSLNKLTGTLNRERETIGAALDSFGPALKALNDQHAKLVAMLTALDRLGKIGTHVIRQSRADIVATLKHLGPTLKGLADAGTSLAPGSMLMASFPFPPSAKDLAKGYFSNALFNINIDLNALIAGAGGSGNGFLPHIASLCAAYAGQGSCAPLMSALCGVTGFTTFCTASNPGGLLSQLNLLAAPAKPKAPPTTTTTTTPQAPAAKPKTNPLAPLTNPLAPLTNLGSGSGGSSPLSQFLGGIL